MWSASISATCVALEDFKNLSEPLSSSVGQKVVVNVTCENMAAPGAGLG